MELPVVTEKRLENGRGRVAAHGDLVKRQQGDSDMRDPVGAAESGAKTFTFRA